MNNIKKFKVCIASRFMYNEYREYNVYTINAKNYKNAINYAKRVISHWNKKSQDTRYELYDLWQLEERSDKKC